MIIRYGGGNTGVAEYLENGRKVDRHYSRDELDRRIPIEGDLSVTQALYESIEDTGQERYLHISLSFNEPDVTEEDLREVFQQYKKEFMAAYGDDEYNIYAEIHWPKVKEAYNHNTEQMEPRYPHVHVVIPKKNLVTGGFLNPAGMHEQHVKYLDAIQEKLNRDNGLSSPRNSPRVGTNHYESALAKYKDKEFKSKNGELKRHIFDSMLSRDIRTEKDFKSLLGEYGEVRVRNQSKDNQYFAVKLPGDEKFTNLKANIFGRQFIEERALVLEPITDAQVARRVETWRAIRSKEIKYIHNASAKVKAEYKSLSLPARREFLEKWERSYVERYKQASSDKRPGIPGLSARDNLASNLKLAGGISTERARYLHELQASTVDYFNPQGQPANRLFLHGDADADIQHFQPERDSGLRSDLYDGSTAGGISPLPSDGSRSSVVDSLLAEEAQRDSEKNDLKRFAEIRKNLDPQHLLAFAQIKYGIDPAQHAISHAKDGSPRIKAGKYNYNVSDFLTKHIGLDWSEASGVLQNLYDRQQSGVVDRPKPKEQHIDDWRRFRNEIYPKSVKTYDELKGQIKISYALGLKAINSEFYARRASITKDATLTRFDKHYFRSIVILEKLQKVEDLQQRIKEQNSVANRAKYPYSTLFYDFATKNEDLNMKVLDDLKRRFQTPAMDSENTIGARGPLTPKHMPDGAEAAKRARLLAKLQTQEREAKELKIKLADLRPRPLANNAVAFCHKDHGKQIFVNHPDRLELNRVTDQDEVGVALIYGVERFGSPLEINGTEQFKEQVIQVAAERDMDITFTDEAMNKALEAKRLELGLQPLTANSIAPQELEIDKTMPKEEAIDKALLASKVAELRAINAGALEQPNEAEREIYAAVVAEAQERHEEMAAAPFLDSERIEEIAREDFQAFAQLEGQPEQQQLAISMAQALENEHYKSFAEQNGPQELQLTIDATLALESEPEPVELAAEESAPVEPLSAERMASLSNQARNLETQASTLSAEIQQMRMAGSSQEQIQERETELAGLQAERAKTLLQVLPQMREEEFKAGASPERLERLDSAIQEAQATLAEGSQPERIEQSPAPELSAEEREQINQARADFGMEPMADPAQPSPAEPLQFTDSNGQPVSIDLSRFQQQPEPLTVERLQAEVEGYGQAEQEARGALEGLEQQREEQGMFLSEDDANALDEKIAEAAQRVEDMAQAKERSQQELWAAAPELRPAPEQPEPLQFTNNGEPATINLDRFQQPEPPSVERLQAEVEGYGRAEQEAREALAQLQQQRDQLGADLDPNDATALDERIVEASERVDSMALAKTQAQQELWQAAPELRPTEPEPLRFTHQGQPATLDLDRFTAPEQRLSPAVAAKVAELQAVNERAAEKPDVMAEIVSRGTVADATMRHDGIRDGSADRNAVREAARQDLVAFADLDGRPEQQQLAREIGSMMENPDYRDYMASHAPESVSLTVEATQAMDSARGISKEKEADKGMEL
ncbi:LPD7 domain-containing protein [Pseudomonas aeruginosa]|uniref:LPD7 domain-containing protein n=1 Tax=Pseudomonas aeruginosa TaxID=287 RepID=UPI003D9CBA47